MYVTNTGEKRLHVGLGVGVPSGGVSINTGEGRPQAGLQYQLGGIVPVSPFLGFGGVKTWDMVPGGPLTGVQSGMGTPQIGGGVNITLPRRIPSITADQYFRWAGQALNAPLP